ncbi:unnamed protein product, partial [Meganyctiphanes norvegica]
MDRTSLILLTLFCTMKIYCREECSFARTHTFEIDNTLQLLFSAEIKEVGGLVIDINYEDKTKDRIKLSSKESFKHIYNGKKHIKSGINSLINEGWNDIDIFVSNKTVNVTCESSQMSPLTISIHKGIKSIIVSSENLTICQESCNIENSIEKIINNEENLKITAFIAHNYPITFKISNPVEEVIGHFEMKPSDCTFTRKQTNTKIPCDHINTGWNKLNIFVNRTTLTINDHIIPVDGSLKTLSILGKYLVNCTKGTPVWKITNEEEILIPISSDQEVDFILTSKVPFLPIFNLNGIKLTLKWDNGLKISSTGSPLQPKIYHIIFESSSESLILYNEKKSDELTELKFKKVPEFISVSSLKGEYQFALSVEDPLPQPTEPSPVPGPSN